MIINGRTLLKAQPLSPMAPVKLRRHGVSHGLAEAGYDIRVKQRIIMHPFRRFRLASTIECFDMPENLVAIVHDKSSFIRRGLMVGNSVIEPGWKGFLTLELFYFGWKPLCIQPGSGIAQVIFHELTERASYGNGKYQNQADRPVEAK